MSSNPQFSSKISNLRSLVRRVYETVEPRSETKETPQTYLLHVYLPGTYLFIYIYINVCIFVKIIF